ncbi:VCBS repeat-containing protein [Flectobacillus rivi]|uniref:VCBS repeat-containing protein n=1 Tax=Flectobacillus rivi TaxID=2984209 RepID=A0ABT6Z6A1_9BACT|nr:VCBS repeat-containing protein [Flectobacillus rivi]MDI9876666.1 VCBS repeat-containing protein [Flectobacillus rivi]
MKKIVGLLVSISCLWSCSTSPKDTLFEELSASQTGVDFTNHILDRPDFNIFNYRNFYNGGGVALGDLNNDGLPDMFLTSNFEQNRLYLNKGNLQFEDITEKSGILGKKFWSTGVTMADVNGDGLLDIYVCNSGNKDNRGNQLYINQGIKAGMPTFKEQAQAYGLTNGGFTTHAAFFDYDRDGDLDMYCLNNSFTPMDRLGYANLRAKRDSLGGDKLYRNDNNHFVDVSDQAGIYGSLIGFGLGVTVGDVNNDNWPDIYVSNDFYERDYLYINQRNGTFKEAIEEQIGHTPLSSMGSDIADLNNDGWQDIIVTEMFPESEERVKRTATYESYDFFQFKLKQDYYYQYMRNMVHINNGDGTFSEMGQQLGLHATDWSWGGLMFDMDNDGLKDFFVATGIMKDLTDQDYIAFLGDENTMQQMLNGKKFDYHEFVDKMTSTPVPNYAFKNLGNLKFENHAEDFGLEGPGFSNGAAYADLDNDGDLDLVVNNNDSPVSIYRNKTNEKLQRNYLKIRLKGYEKNVFGVGAKVSIFQKGEQQVLQQLPNRGFQSSMDLSLNFGLGKNATIDSLVIIWSDDAKQTLRNIKANQTLTLEHAQAKERFVYKTPNNLKPLLVNHTVQSGWKYTHVENDFVDYNRDGLLKQKYSTQGPALAVGDINGDGIEDVFIGGSATQPKQIYLQSASGQLSLRNMPSFEPYKGFEVVDALLFDADGDKDLDLYWVTGSNEFLPNDPQLADCLFLNDGKGNFTYSPTLPTNRTSGACAKALDYDLDGDLDLFVGTRMTPARYGQNPNSFILQNDGKGNFKDVSGQLLGTNQALGMITDVTIQDLNGDHYPEIIAVGDWMSVVILQNNKGKSFTKSDLGNQALNGWWNAIQAADLDNDGDLDFVLGNLGNNHHFKVSATEPAELYVNDFDKNGSFEQIMTCYRQGEPWPMVLKADLQKQLPEIKQKFLKFSDYASAQMGDLFEDSQLESATVQKVNNSESGVMWNLGKGQFKFTPFPMMAQTSPITSIQCVDLNKDGVLEIIMNGNFFDVLPEIGRFDANYGVILQNDGKGNFRKMTSLETGFLVKGQVRKTRILKKANGKKALLIAKNNDTAEIWDIVN